MKRLIILALLLFYIDFVAELNFYIWKASVSNETAVVYSKCNLVYCSVNVNIAVCILLASVKSVQINKFCIAHTDIYAGCFSGGSQQFKQQAYK